MADARLAPAALLADVVWIEPHAIQTKWKEAHKALGKVDDKDVPYLACALAVGADAIWSYDKDFDAQNLVPRVTHPTTT